MLSIVTSRTRETLSRRPRGPLVMNRASLQAVGLVAWYPAHPSTTGSGNTWNNAVNTQFTLTNTNTVPVALHQEGGRTFNFVPASSHHFKLTSAVLTVAPLTLACWLIPDVTSALGLIDLHNSTAATTRQSLQLLTSAAAIVAQACDASAANLATSLTVFRALELTHACGVFPSTTSRSAFCNGTGKATNVVSTVPSGINRTAIGARLNVDAGITFYDGHLLDARIYNRALSDSDVYALYDPETRWELYYPIGRVSYFFPAAAAATLEQTHYRWRNDDNDLSAP